LVIGQATPKKQTIPWLAPITTCYVKAERMGAWGRIVWQEGDKLADKLTISILFKL